FFSSRRRHTRFSRDWSSDVCSSDLAAFEELASQEFQKRNETQELYIPPGPRLGEKVFELNDISKHFGDKVLYEHLSFNIPRGAKIGRASCRERVEIGVEEV